MKAPRNALSGAVGFVTDIYLMATCRLQNPHSYLKFVTINQVRRATRSTTFIETGTYLGGTAYRCSKVFAAVYTIELNPDLARKARENLSSCRNVEVIEGDAVIELDNVLRERGVERATVFLDGHFSGGNTACGAVAEPAIEVIDVLARHRHRINGIVIDDFRNFGVEPGHPAKSRMLHALETNFPETQFTIRVQNDQVIVARQRC